MNNSRNSNPINIEDEIDFAKAGPMIKDLLNK